MKIIFSDFKRGEAKVKITNLDDFWYLSQIIDEKDVVKGETLRKIKVGSGEQQDIIKKPVFLSIEVEKTEFAKETNIFRISGIILEGPDDVPKGTHHTFNVEENSIIIIIKNNWLSYQIDKLNEATEIQSKVLMVVFDREDAYFAKSSANGFDFLSELHGNVAKKADEKKIESEFYSEILKQIKEYESRYGIHKIIVASPAFWKDYLLKEIKDEALKKKIISATCSSTDRTAFNEVLKRPEVETALKQARSVEEITLVEQLLKEIFSGKLAKYGFDEVDKVANSGAINILLVTDSLIKKTRQENSFKKIDELMKKVDSMKGKIKIISSEHEGGKKLDGLSGIAALLRYQID